MDLFDDDSPIIEENDKKKSQNQRKQDINKNNMHLNDKKHKINYKPYVKESPFDSLRAVIEERIGSNML